jgi:hypothetical protein
MQVYVNRKSLASTLQDSQTVVAQVESAVYVTLIIVLAFVSLAIFDTNSLQRTWTGLSASLISFSFIFGNSIRQVCCGRTCFVCSAPCVRECQPSACGSYAFHSLAALLGKVWQ